MNMELSQQNRRYSSKNGVSMGRDRLSEMPDEIIVHILSCLPAEDAVRTVLLRRFGNLWTLVHILDFDILEFLNTPWEYVFRRHHDTDEIEPYYIFVRNVLMLHRNPSIDKFHLRVGSECWDSNDDTLMCWQFALNRQAKEIIFRDISKFGGWDISLVSNFTSQFLVTLELYSCSISSGLQVSLGSLNKLLLEDVTMCVDSFQQLLSGCPSLQELCINEPMGIDKLSFAAPNIHKLTLVLQDRRDPWVLDFPNLKSLDLEMCWIVEVIDVSSLRDVNLQSFICPIKKDEESLCNKFLRKFEGAEVFRLSYAASEVFLHSLHAFDLVQIRWKRVILQRVGLCESCLLGIYELLRSLKHLEELTISITMLMGADQLKFIEHVSAFERASTSAKVFFV